MPELGRLLSEARNEKSLSLSDVENAIRIRQKYLEALETGNYAALPRGATSRGFLRNYARFLGLPVEETLKLYVAESGDSGPVIPMVSADERLTDYRPLEVELMSEVPHTGWGRWILALVVVALLVAGGWGLFGNRLGLPMPNWKLPLPAALAARAQTVTPTATVAATATRWVVRVTATPPAAPTLEATQPVVLPTSDLLPFPTPTLPPTVTPTPQPTATPEVVSRIMLHALITQRSWVSVEVDGETVEQGVLEANQERDWEADSSIFVRTGNAAGVVLTLNNEDLGPMGNVGQVVERRWVMDQGEVTEASGTPGAGPQPTVQPTPAG